MSELARIGISGRVIRALFLIIKPTDTWKLILLERRSIGFLLVRYLLPMMLVTAMAEGFGMVKWGKSQSLLHRIQTFTVGETVIYEITRLLAMLLIVVVCAVLVKMFGETFRERHTYLQTFTLVIYALGPLFLLRLLDATPVLSPWITWGLGVVLCTEVLYQGVPQVLEPDPPNAFGIYFMSSLVLVAITGLERLVTAWYLSGRMSSINDIVARLLNSFHRHQPF